MSRVWFITGSSRGLGRALVEYALKSGDKVAATARSVSSLSELTNKYEPDTFLALPLDVNDYAEAENAIQKAAKHFGRLDVVVNNAGYADVGSVEDTPLSSFRSQIETNFFGVVNVSKAVVGFLRKQGFGHIFQISSLGGRLGSPGLSAYQSAKWAVGGFSLCLAAELKPLNVKVTVLEPGAMKTDWAGSSMSIPDISKPYESTVGSFASMLKSGSADSVTQPEKVGPIIRTLLETEEPPTRILIGPDAVQYGIGIAQALKESDEKWQNLSRTSA